MTAGNRVTFLEWYRIKNNNKKDQSLLVKELTKDFSNGQDIIM